MLTADQARDELRKYCSSDGEGRRPIRANGILAPRLAHRIAENLNDRTGDFDSVVREKIDIELRARIVEETCRLLGVHNVETDGHHVRITGALGTYSVHLGSGIVHRIPGNTLFIIPVSARHRGRVFLPFVDDDPRTAEIVSKVVMLSADDKIKDPTILSQLVR